MCFILFKFFLCICWSKIIEKKSQIEINSHLYVMHSFFWNTCSSSNHKVEFIFTMKGVYLVLLSCLVFTKTLTSNLGEFYIHWLNYFFNDCNYETVKTNSFYVRLPSYMYKAFDVFRFTGKLYDFWYSKHVSNLLKNPLFYFSIYLRNN